MNKCKKCGIDFTISKGHKNYCSIQCRNSRSWSDIDKKKKSDSAKRSIKVQIAQKNRKNNIELTKLIWKKISESRKISETKKILNKKYSDLKYDTLKKRILIEQNYKCYICNIHEWNDKPITLHLDHIDGNRINNDRKNLRCICPNCHSQTNTYCGRNNKSGFKNKINDSILLEKLIECNWNIRQALIKVGIAPKGGNYNRCYKLKREFELNNNIK